MAEQLLLSRLLQFEGYNQIFNLHEDNHYHTESMEISLFYHTRVAIKKQNFYFTILKYSTTVTLKSIQMLVSTHYIVIVL